MIFWHDSYLIMGMMGFSPLKQFTLSALFWWDLIWAALILGGPINGH